MSAVQEIDRLRTLPHHLVALQYLVDRCESAADKKELIVTAGALEIISPDEGFTMVTANMVEEA